MTTVADIKRITRLVREREPRLILSKRMLILPPVGHYVRGFYLDQTSGKDMFRPSYLVQPLYRPRTNWALGYGDRFTAAPQYGLFSIENPGTENQLAELLLGEGMRRIEHVDSPEAFLEYSKTLEPRRTAGDWHVFHTLALLGRLDEARVAGERSMEKYYRAEWDHCRQSRRLLHILDGGQERVDRLLRKWEQQVVKELKLEPYWQSPWPS
jgi:hypothetical protein